MSGALAELFVVLGLKGGKETVSTMKGLLDVTVATKSAFLQNLEVLYKWSEAAREAAMNLEIYQTNTGLSGEQLQRLSYKAAQAGVSINELGGQIQKIQQMSKDIELGQGDAKPFQLMEIDPRQNPIDILDELGEKLRSLYQYDPARAKQMANMFGLSDTMFYSVLDESNEQMNEQFLLTQKEQKALVQLNKEWNKVWFYIKQIGIKLQGMGAVFQSGFVRVLLNAVQGIGELLTRLMDVINANEDLKNLLLVIGGILSAVFAPWLLQLAAIGLILEDIFIYFQGGDSVTGQIIEWINQSERFRLVWAGIKTVFEGFRALLMGLKEIWDGYIGPMIVGLNELVDGKLGSILLTALDAALNPMGTIMEGIGGIRELISGGNSSSQTNNVTFQSSGDVAKDQQVASDFVKEVSDAQDVIPAAVG